MTGKTWSLPARLMWLVLIAGVAAQWWRAALIGLAAIMAVAVPLGMVARGRERTRTARQDEALARIMARYHAETRGSRR